MWGYGPGSGMMGGWGYVNGFGLLHMIFWVIVLIAVIAGVIWLVRTLASPGTHRSTARLSSALDVLEERYAKGRFSEANTCRRNMIWAAECCPLMKGLAPYCHVDWLDLVGSV